jgi:hypothetical protein
MGYLTLLRYAWIILLKFCHHERSFFLFSVNKDILVAIRIVPWNLTLPLLQAHRVCDAPTEAPPLALFAA